MSRGGLPYPCVFHTEDDGLFGSFNSGCVQCLQYEIFKLEEKIKGNDIDFQNTKEKERSP